MSKNRHTAMTDYEKAEFLEIVMFEVRTEIDQVLSNVFEVYRAVHPLEEEHMRVLLKQELKLARTLQITGKNVAVTGCNITGFHGIHLEGGVDTSTENIIIENTTLHAVAGTDEAT